MAYVKDLYNTNFLEYASYVIKDRAIPHIVDGMKPVQRRILHSLLDMDDGKFHKVANVVGHAMKYHPHGDSSIYSALVVLANKELFIDKQGNFGNIMTGDPASAGRYIECRLLPFGKRILHSPEVTEFEDSYDGRNKEPVVFPAKVPLVLIQGAEGIAVGMATKILPHNFKEVVSALKAALQGQPFQLFPDFIQGGELDVSGYNDGNGKVLVRAKFDVSRDEKRIVIREVPYGTTTESLIASIEGAAKKGKLKLQSISDFTTENVEIEIKLARGVKAQDMIDALYAFTDCEVSISVNLLVIKDNLPVNCSVTEVIQFHAGHLVQVLEAELNVEKAKLEDRLHARTLEQIFIEERIYKRIESKKTQKGVMEAVITGFEPFKAQIMREVTPEDVERLLKIPIRRISLYDIEKAKREMKEISDRLKEIAHHLKHLVEYAVGTLEAILDGAPAEVLERRTDIRSFNQIDVKVASKRDIALYYDKKNGYIGTSVRGGAELLRVSDFDRVLLVKKDVYQVVKVPDKLFVGKDLLYCGHVDDDVVNSTTFTMLYKNGDNQAYVKRFQITKFITDKIYPLLPEGCKALKLTLKERAGIQLDYKPKPRLKSLTEQFSVEEYLVKGVKAQGVRLSTKEIKSAKFFALKKGDK